MPAPTLEQRVADVESDITQLRHRADRAEDTAGSLMAGINRITSEIHQLDNNLGRCVLDVAQGVDRVERMVGDLGGRMAGLEERFGGLEGRQEALEERLTGVETRLTGVENGLAEVKGLLEQVLARLGG